MSNFQNSLNYSNGIITHLRSALSVNCAQRESTIVCGSYARGEASAESDIDYFTLYPKDKPLTEDRKNEIRTLIAEKVKKPPAAGGAFADSHHPETILDNIGGQDDSNNNITRRVLLLLEGTWVSGETEFKKLRYDVLRRYISPHITDHQLALFLLNDIIRYYRTIAVDYEFKTSLCAEPKPGALRNIKLIFSRKLLYASGLFSVALTCNRRADEKIRILENLFDLPSMNRLIQICGEVKTIRLCQHYDRFLEKLSDASFRTHLDSLTVENRISDPIFRDIKNEGHSFTRELNLLFENTFDSTHPIRLAAVF